MLSVESRLSSHILGETIPFSVINEVISCSFQIVCPEAFPGVKISEIDGKITLVL
jgi:hypothetical protein